MLLFTLFEVISNVLLQAGSGTNFPDKVNVAEAVDATTETAKGVDKIVAIPLICIPVDSNSLLVLPLSRSSNTFQQALGAMLCYAFAFKLLPKRSWCCLLRLSGGFHDPVATTFEQPGVFFFTSFNAIFLTF